MKVFTENYQNYSRSNMKVMLGMTTSGLNKLYSVRKWDDKYDKPGGIKKCIYLSEDEMKHLDDLRYGDEISMKYKKHVFPKRVMYYQDVIFDYLYRNGFEYLFEE